MAKVQIKTRTTKSTTFHSGDFQRACSLIATQTFEDYDLYDQCFVLFYDTEDRIWEVKHHNGKYFLFIEETPIVPLGKLQHHIFNFISEMEADKKATEQETQEWHKHNAYLHRNFGHGRI